MKKLVFLLVCALVVLTACSREQSEYADDPGYTDDTAYEDMPVDDSPAYEDAYMGEDDVQPEGDVQPEDEYTDEDEEYDLRRVTGYAQAEYGPEAWAGWTREGFLEDIDYMMWVLEENFPFMGTIYRRFGVDMQEKADSLREIVADESREIDARIFHEMLRAYFFAYGGSVGHLGVISPQGYHDRRDVLMSTSGSHPNLPAINSPASVAFYGEPMHRDDIEPAYQRRGYDSNFFLEIIEEGQIAYMRLVTMLTRDFVSDIDRMTDIYEQIQGYEHFIIDIRGNPGGQPLFDFLILGPNLEDDLHIPMLGFYMGGEHNLRFLESWNFDPTPVSEIDMGGIPDFYTGDLRFIDYKIPIPWWVVEADPSWIDLPLHGFSGKIWLLMDDMIFSAAEAAALMSRETGFITLVGEQGGGAVGGVEATWVSLPNSGIILSYDAILITDQYGRCINEFPTMPHHFNRPGMDALETTLLLIEEGVY